MEPKLRTLYYYSRVKKEKVLDFGDLVKQYIKKFLDIFDDPIMEISRTLSGRDLTIEYKSLKKMNNYPTTTIRVKPSQTPLSDNSDAVYNLLENQTEITDLYSELSYDELKDVLEGWLNPTAESSSDEPTSESTTLSESKPKQEVNDLPFDVDESKPTPSKKTDDVASAFDDLFNN